MDNQHIEKVGYLGSQLNSSRMFINFSKYNLPVMNKSESDRLEKAINALNDMADEKKIYDTAKYLARIVEEKIIKSDMEIDTEGIRYEWESNLRGDKNDEYVSEANQKLHLVVQQDQSKELVKLAVLKALEMFPDTRY